MEISLDQKISLILNQTIPNSQLEQYIDRNLPIPKVYCKGEDIRLIILGQDPTVKNPLSRKKVKHVLNLDKSGNLKIYIENICQILGLELDKNIYATNLLKNFFVIPPTQFKNDTLLMRFADIWLPLLYDELSCYNNIPVLTLGQPVLSLILNENSPGLVREYWGYNKEWKSGKTLQFKYVSPAGNKLGRMIFPFPHQPSITKQFYRDRMVDYTIFMRNCMC